MTVLAMGMGIADRYRLVRRIAVGGMGEVWEASDLRLGRVVAIKVLKLELSHDGEFLHRFRIEAQTAASLSHVGIAAVHDYGEDDSHESRLAYLVMELVGGQPLSARLAAAGRLDADQTLSLLEQTGHALQAAHERGYVHRDIKPGNLLITEGGLVKITDFGIAKAANAVPVTASGMVMGTAHYIAPEQAMGGEAGPAGDVYSLGIVGYECLTGRRPFEADNQVTVAMMQIRDEPPPLPLDVPLPVRALVEAALVKDPRQRYASGGEFATAAAAVRRGMPLPRPGEARATATVGPRRPVDAAAARQRGGDRDETARAGQAGGAAAAVLADRNPATSTPREARSAGVDRPAVQPAAAVDARDDAQDDGPDDAGGTIGTVVSPVSPIPAVAPGQHRLPGSRRAGGRALLALYLLLVVAAVGLGTVVVRDALNKPAQVAPPGSVELTETSYVGRSASAVRGELRAQAVVPRVVNTNGAAPANEGGCTVTTIAPKGIVKINSPVTVTCLEPVR